MSLDSTKIYQTLYQKVKFSSHYFLYLLIFFFDTLFLTGICGSKRIQNCIKKGTFMMLSHATIYDVVTRYF